jgi:hypothetical protein
MPVEYYVYIFFLNVLNSWLYLLLSSDIGVEFWRVTIMRKSAAECKW